MNKTKLISNDSAKRMAIISSAQLGTVLLARLSALIFTVLLIVGASFAQSETKPDRRPDRGFQSANSYSISDIENVNLSNGNLMMNIPLASLAPGRGTTPGFTVALSYNSKLWDSKREFKGNPLNNPYTRELIVPGDGGWYMDTGNYRLNLINRTDFEGEAPCGAGEDEYRRNGYRFKLELQMPNGGVTEFRPFPGIGDATAYSEYPGYPDGYFSLDPYGVRHTYSYLSNSGENPSCSESAVSITTNGINYYTTDGSGLRLFLPYQPNLGVSQMNWKLYFPDGRVVDYLPQDDTTVYQRLTDRNGNKLFWKSATQSGLNGIKIEDEVGHFIFVSQNKIIQPGANGQFLETTLHWKDIWVHHSYRATDAPNADPAFIYADFTWNLGAIDKITLPVQAGGLEYTFTYHASDTPPVPGNFTQGWGQLKSVTLPSKAKAEYSYSLEGNDPEMKSFGAVNISVGGRNLIYERQYDGGTPELVTETTSYGIVPGTGVGGSCAPNGSCETQYAAIGGDLSGYAYRTTRTGGSMTEKIWINKRPTGSPNVYQLIEPIVKTEFSSIPDADGTPVLTAIKDYDYDQNGNILVIREYDWVPFNSVPRSTAHAVDETLPANIKRATGLPDPNLLTLKRKTINTYYNPTPNTLAPVPNSTNHYSNPSSPPFKNLLKSTEIQDGNGNPVSRSEFYYDYASPAPTKGNLTETRVWDSTKMAALPTADAYGYKLTAGNFISTTIQYDAYGNPTLTTDANNNQTEITYGSINGFSGLYPTEIKQAFNNLVQRTSQTEYDFNTGLATASFDVDNNVRSETVYDALGRPKTQKAAVGTAQETRSQIDYYDSARYIVTKADLNTVGDGKKVSAQFFDQLGRIRLSKTLEDASIQSATNETDGIKVQTRYLSSGTCTYSTTNEKCSFQLISNPYRADYSYNASSETTMGWTRSQTVNTGRHSEIETFSGAGLPERFAASNPNSNSTGKVKTDIDAERTLVTDQTQKQRISQTNALGQLVKVWEVTGQDANTVSISFPNQSLGFAYETSYSYDTLNNLTGVLQGSQQRTFAYSSLSRLKSAINPELGKVENNSYVPGTVFYTYDNGGNLKTKLDPRGIKTIYDYDALSRIKTRCYLKPNVQAAAASCQGIPSADLEPSTSSVSYDYDGSGLSSAPLYSKGKLTRVSNGVSTTQYQDFDALGRVTKSQQAIGYTSYPEMTYVYNLAGILTEEKYPSGRIVKNVLDEDGDLSIVKSYKNENHQIYRDYARRFSYTAAGAVSSMQLGNGNWETTQFNSRLQPTQIGLGMTQNQPNLLKLNYTYNTPNTSDNNGNVKTQSMTVPGVGLTPGFTATQTYNYDSLNRLKDATETIGTSQPWKQTYNYDRFGNRTFDEANSTTLLKNCGTAPNQTVCPGDVPVVNPSIDPANNNRLQGYGYDEAGNMTRDAQSRKFTYDGENKQTKVENVDANGNSISKIGEYFYDGDGRRVKKITYNQYNQPVETTIFIYDASGKLVAEYSTNVATASNAKVSYLTNDHLGSPRIITDQNGNVTSRRDFLPFGEEIGVTTPQTAGRSGHLQYSGDITREKFATYERDAEIGLDYAQARYYSFQNGRFTSTDPIMASSSINSPQSFNRYVYVENNPINLNDPTGLCPKCFAGYKIVDKPYTLDVITDNIAQPPLIAGSTAITLPQPISLPAGAGAAGVAVGVAVGIDQLEQQTGVPLTTGSTGAMIGTALANTVKDAIGIKENAPAIPTTTTADPPAQEENLLLFRGIPVGHPGYADALKGIARPIGGHSDPSNHVLGDTNSIFTSWTYDPTYAQQRAGSGGVFMSKEIPVSQTEPVPRWLQDEFSFESEVLVRGTVTGARATIVP
jgi:RHS repeat-associated protein